MCLNDVLWTLNFGLPTVDSALINTDSGMWFGDIDLGEMFSNYWLDEQLRPCIGVDVLTLGSRSWDKYGNLKFIQGEWREGRWERWLPTLMGL